MELGRWHHLLLSWDVFSRSPCWWVWAFFLLTSVAFNEPWLTRASYVVTDGMLWVPLLLTRCLSVIQMSFQMPRQVTGGCPQHLVQLPAQRGRYSYCLSLLTLSKIFYPQHFALWNPESIVLSKQNWNLQQAFFLGLSWSKSVQNRQSLPKCSPFQYYWNVFGEVFKETMEGILHFWCPLVINTDILDDVKRQVSWRTAPTTDPLESGAQTAPVYLILRRGNQKFISLRRKEETKVKNEDRARFRARVRPHSCLTLCGPLDCRLPGSFVHGIFQARILDWVAIFSPREFSGPRDRTHISCISCIAGRFFTTEPPGKPQGFKEFR